MRKGGSSGGGSRRESGKAAKARMVSEASELIHFRYDRAAAAAESARASGYNRSHGGGGQQRRGYSQSSALTKAQFMQANFKFLLSPLTAGDEPCLHDPDSLVPWSLVECVVLPARVSVQEQVGGTVARGLHKNSNGRRDRGDSLHSLGSVSSAGSGPAEPGPAEPSAADWALIRQLQRADLGGSCTQQGVGPEMGPEPEPEEALGEEPSCPICLTFIQLPKITSCGHLFCYTCVLRHLHSEYSASSYCPICAEGICASDLKTVVMPHRSSSRCLVLAPALVSLAPAHCTLRVGDYVELTLMTLPRDSIIPQIPIPPPPQHPSEAGVGNSSSGSSSGGDSVHRAAAALLLQRAPLQMP
mmetsp:Transcript_3972/g.8662  ORF Transcript_3972/g.8662 Transcript_3972/m.8662 type:complete len:358 (-) Transcript_3972:157-1230(-)